MKIARGKALAGWIWLAWVFVAVAMTAKLLAAQVDYFEASGVPHSKVLLYLFPFATLAYAWLRRAWLWQYELAAAGALGLVVALYAEPRAVAAALAILAAGYALGAIAAGALKLELAAGAERLVVRCGLGFGILITILFAVGTARLAYPFAIGALLVMAMAARWRELGTLGRDFGACHRAWIRSPALRQPVVGLTVAVAFVALLSALLVGIAPATNADTLAWHLPIVQSHVASHAITPIPGFAYSYFPQGAECLWVAGYSFAGQAGAQLVSLTFLALFLLAAVCLARAAGLGAAAAVAGALWAATLPFLHWTGSVMKNDLLLALFQALSLYAFLRSIETRRLSWIVAGAFFLGQTFAVKLVALFGAVPLACLFAYAIWRQPRRLRAAVLSLPVMLLGFGWAAQTYALKGNPAYPSSTGQAIAGAAAHHGQGFAEKAARYPRLVWDIVFHGQRMFESRLASPAGIILLVFLPLIAASCPGWNRASIVCAIFAAVYFAYWAAMVSTIRYAIVPVTITALLAAQAATQFYAAAMAAPRWLAKFAVVGAAAYSLFFSILGVMMLEINVPQIAYLARRIDRPAYLRAALLTYRSLEFLAAHAKPGDVVFGIDNCSRAYAPDPACFACVLRHEAGASPEALPRLVSQSHACFLIVPKHDPPAGALAAIRDGRWERVYEDNSFETYRLR